MAYGTLVSNLLLMLKAEVGASMTTGVATAQDTVYIRLLSNKQQQLVHEYDFPNLEVKVTQALATRYGTFPTTVSRDRPFTVEVSYNGSWMPLEYGIDAAEFDLYNSDDGETGDPIRRWQFNNDGSTTPASLTLNRYEVWPVPAASQNVRFVGSMVLPVLLATTDRAVLDDQMLVLFVASDLLQKDNQELAVLKLRQAQQIAGRLVATLPRREPVFKIGGSRGMATETRLVKIQAI